MSWKKQEQSPGDVYYDIWHNFWGKPLDLLSKGDGENTTAVDMTLTIHAGLTPLLDTNGSLIVRQEYLDAVVALNERYEKKPYSGAIVIGHPGIGECLHDKFTFCWSQQLSRDILVSILSFSPSSSERKKTILNLDPARAIHLFDSSGYYIFEGRFIEDLSPMADDAWALVDSENRDVDPNPLLTSSHSRVFMVFSSSPNENRYKDYHNQKGAMYYVMQNWTFDEIWAGAKLRRADKVDKDALRGYFEKYGPSPRTTYDLYDGETTPQRLDQSINEALQNITADHLERLVSIAKGDILGSTTDQQNVSHSVILASPHPDNRAILRGEIITLHVFQLLEAKLFENDIVALVKAFKLFHIHPQVTLAASVTCGWIFECYCHQMLYKHVGRKLELIPLIATKNTKRHDVSFMLCRCASVDSPSNLTDLTIAHRERYFFSKQDTLTLSDAKYYRPLVKNNASYDAFMTDADSALAFQFTIRENHDVAESGIADLQTRINDLPVKFILLVPEYNIDRDIHLDMPETIWNMRNTRNLKFYMAAVDVKVYP